MQPAFPPLAMTGRATRYAVRAASCDSAPVSASAEVRGPAGEVVPSTVISFAAAIATATVEFTAQSPGAHTLTVTFEPSGEQRTLTTWAPLDRSGEPALRLSNNTLVCSSVAVSRGGAVCLSPNRLSLTGGSTRALPDFNGAMMTTAGDVVWEYDSSGVRRLELTDAGWSVLEGPSSATLHRFVSAASETSLLLGDDGRIVEYAADGDGGLSRRDAPLPTDAQMVAGLAVTDGGVVYLRDTEVCFGELHGAARCREWGPLELLAPEGDGLWLSDPATREVGFARFGNSNAPVSLQFFRPDPDVARQLVRLDQREGLRSPAFGLTQSLDTTTRPASFTLALTRGPLGLEAWEQPLGTLASGVTPRHVWFQSNDELLIFTR